MKEKKHIFTWYRKKPLQSPERQRTVQEVATTTKEERRETNSELQTSEHAYWSTFLGIKVEVPPLPRDITPELIEKFKGDPEYMGIRSVPMLAIGTLDDLRRMGVDYFLNRIQQRYPGLHVFESLSDAEKQDHTIGRLPKKWYWEQVKDGNVPFPEGYNKGAWLLTEVMPKPMYGSSYEPTMISHELGHIERFNVTWDTAHQDILRHKVAILSKIGLSGEREVRMHKTEEFNMLSNREGLGATNTYEWTEDEYHHGESGDSGRLVVGLSGDGGATNVRWAPPGRSLGNIGFRVVVVLGP